jgi:hypothetical protein
MQRAESCHSTAPERFDSSKRVKSPGCRLDSMKVVGSHPSGPNMVIRSTGPMLSLPKKLKDSLKN